MKSGGPLSSTLVAWNRFWILWPMVAVVDDDANEPLWFFYRLGSKDAGFTYVEANGLFGWKKRDDKWDDIVRLFSFNEI